MQILQGKIKKHSRPVMPNDDITAVAKEMQKLCLVGAGRYPAAHALCHCQVDDQDPMRFFVTAQGRLIENPKILSKDEPIMHLEGCMSFACRDQKKVRRYNRIEVEYDEAGERKREVLTGFIACVFQHEIQHMNGGSIYQ